MKTSACWSGRGEPLSAPPPTPAPPPARASEPARVPLASTPAHLAEKILTSRSALEGERKQVTVLFADLKGSMELLAERDPEEARQLLDPVLERMIEAVHRYEGTVNQVMGDGIMALFGAPIAHEDHAVRACYAALRMQETVTRYGDEMQRSHGVPVQIRVGLHSGAVVVRAIDSSLHMDYTAVGQTTHLAARMEQMAKPGSVLTTGETLRLAEGFVQVKALGPVAVKGLADPVEVFELVGASSTRTRLQAFAARGLTRFVGRQAEIEALRQALEHAGTSHGQVVAVIGEPGVGKTRLVYEFIRSHHTHNWLVLESSSVSYGKATAYLPVRDLLKAYFQIDDRDDGRKIREKLTGKLLTLDATLGPTLPAFLALLDVPVEDRHWQALDPTQRRQRTLEAIKGLLLRESQVQPLLLVFENLHWIDAETQAVLDSLIDSLPTARLLLLVNYRPEYQHGWGSKTYYTQLRLDPLPPTSAEELLQALLGDDPSLVPLKRLVIERTEGNPFFLEESVRALVETRVLVGERGAYRPLQSLDRLQVPATVQAVLAARIDRLPPEEKRLLQTAAVIGTEVPFALLQAIGELSEEELRRGLGHLQAAEFLYETSLFPELEYTFKHALTHEVAYGSLLQERRRALHARIVEPSNGSMPTVCPSRRNGWPSMPSGARSGTRPWRTVGRPVPRRWRVRPCERPWCASSRPWQPSRISRRAVPRRSRPSTSDSTCGMRSGHSGNSGRYSTTSARLQPSPRPLTTSRGWGGSPPTCADISGRWGTMTARSRPASTPSPWLRPSGISPCRSWRSTTWVWPTILWATIVGRWGY